MKTTTTNTLNLSETCPVQPDHLRRTDWYDGPNFVGSQYYHMEQIDHDSLIGGEWYSLIWYGLEGQASGLVGGLREDADQRVYFYHVHTDSTYLLYDFNPAVGDSMQVWTGEPDASFPMTQWMYVEGIDTLANNNGTQYKQIGITNYVYPGGPNGVDKWIQGVGGTGGLFTTIGSLSVSVYSAHGCMLASDTLYPWGIPGLCWPTGVDEHITSDVRVAPNPTTSLFHLPQAAESITLFNAMGQLLFRTHGSTIDLGGYPPGIYTAVCQSAPGIATQRLVVVR
jgi:hypothetical protein